MKTQRDSDTHAVVIALVAMAAILLVCAASWFFVEQINDALDTPGEWVGRNLHPPEDSSRWESVLNVVLALAGVGIILLAKLLLLPGVIAGTWALTALAGLCVLVAGYVYFRVRQRG